MDDDFSRDYFKRIEQGEESMLFLSINNNVDLMKFQSLLFSESIPSFCLNTNVGQFLGIINPIKIELYILKNDCNKAIDLLQKNKSAFKGIFRLYNESGKELNVVSITKPTNSTEKIEQGSFFSVEGVCTLSRYWFHLLISIFLVVIDYCYSNYLYDVTPYFLDKVEKIVFFIVILVWNIHMICLGIQRFRSIGLNPWLFIIPIFGGIATKFIPSCKDNSNNKYINYKIPNEKLLKIILLIIALGYSGAGQIKNTLTNSEKQYEYQSDKEVIYTDKNIKITRYNSDDGIYYYFTIYQTENKVLDTVVFYKQETLDYLKSQYLKMQTSNELDYISKFSDWIYKISNDYPAIELYNSEGESIRYYSPEEYENITDELLEMENPSIIRFWFFNFDEAISDFLD